jgi:hypothetical protein
MSLYEKVKSIIDELAENDCVIEYGNIYDAFMNAYVSESTKIPRFINSNIELIHRLKEKETNLIPGPSLVPKVSYEWINP